MSAANGIREEQAVRMILKCAREMQAVADGEFCSPQPVGTAAALGLVAAKIFVSNRRGAITCSRRNRPKRVDVSY